MHEIALRHVRQCTRQRATRMSQRNYAREQHDDIPGEEQREGAGLVIQE
jgi:hypothetical protein